MAGIGYFQFDMKDDPKTKSKMYDQHIMMYNFLESLCFQRPWS